MSLDVSLPSLQQFSITPANVLTIRTEYPSGSVYTLKVSRTEAQLQEFFKTGISKMQWRLPLEDVVPFYGRRCGIDITLKERSCNLFFRFAPLIPGFENLNFERIGVNRVRLVFQKDGNMQEILLKTVEKMEALFANHVVKRALEKNGDIRFFFQLLKHLSSDCRVSSSFEGFTHSSSLSFSIRRINADIQRQWDNGAPGWA